MNPASSSEPAPAKPAETMPPAGLSLAEVNRLNAETIKLVAEANEARARQLRELEEAGRWLQRELAAEASRLEQLDLELRARQARLLESERGTKEGPESRAQAERLSLEPRQSVGVLAKRVESEPIEHRLKNEPPKVETAARAQLVAMQQETERLRAESARLAAQFWPAWLRSEAWRAWRELLLARAAAEGPAALLLARLHLAAALEKSGRPPGLELVRDLGRSAYEAAPDEAERLAQALNQAAEGRFELKVVRLGDRVDHRFMKPAASGIVEVRAVASWAIRDANGQWQFPAEVS